MSTGYGHQCWLGWAEQPDYEAFVAPAKFLEFTEENIKGHNPVISKPTLRSASRNRKLMGKKSVDGGFKAPLQLEGMEQLLKHGFGSVVTTGPVSTLYTHTFALTAALPIGLSIFVNRDAAQVGAGSAFLYQGCKIAKLSIAQTMEDYLQLGCELMGKDWDNGNIVTPTFPTWNPFDYSQMNANSVPSFQIDGEYVGIEDLEVTIEHGLVLRPELGSRLTRQPLRGAMRMVTGKFTAEFDSLTNYNYYKNGAAAVLKAIWTNGTKSLTLNLVDCRFTEGEPSASSADLLKLPMSFDAYSTTVDGNECNAVLVNATVSV